MNIKTPAGTTTTLPVSVCPRCGTIAKSGKMSCCGRGGSWFKSCGGTSNSNPGHTRYEGIQACKARPQSKPVNFHQLQVAQQQGIYSSHGAGGMTNYNSVIEATSNKTFAFTPVNTSAPISDTTSIITATHTSENVLITTSSYTSATTISTNILMSASTHTSAGMSIQNVNTQGFEFLWKITVHIDLLFIITFFV